MNGILTSKGAGSKYYANDNEEAVLVVLRHFQVQ